MMIVLGISGVTCSGKTTLALELSKLLPNSHVIFQDDYFRPENDPNHIWIPELNHINFDVISSLDMEKMHKDIQNYICSSKNIRVNYSKQSASSYETSSLIEKACDKVRALNTRILIIEGFCIFNYKPVSDVCDLKYFLTLPKDVCFNRRSKRVYDPPDCPGYFDLCVWPEYIKLHSEVESSVKDVKFIDNEDDQSLRNVLGTVLLDIINF